jgi:hypothetical protein
MDVLTLIGTGISFVAAGFAAWQAYEARKARKDSYGSAQEAADAANRSAQALEELAELERTKEERKVPPWKLKHHSGNTYVIINDSINQMFNVDISIGTNQARLVKEGFPTKIDGGAEHSFVFIPLPGSKGRNLNVTWSWPDGTLDEWTSQIPPKG